MIRDSDGRTAAELWAAGCREFTVGRFAGRVPAAVATASGRLTVDDVLDDVARWWADRRTGRRIHGAVDRDTRFPMAEVGQFVTAYRNGYLTVCLPGWLRTVTTDFPSAWAPIAAEVDRLGGDA